MSLVQKPFITPLPLVGRSTATRQAAASFTSAIPRRAAVLIEAEAGCRADLVAEALHAQSRGIHPFVAVDCRGDDPLAIEERLFGVVTGEDDVQDLERATDRAAIVESAGGTLFLKDIDELPAAAQRRLGRVLRDGEARLPGRTVRTTFRLVAATARDLEHEMRHGRFRDDLQRRLTRCRIPIAPLRRRPEDIPEILHALSISSPNGSRPARFTRPALAVLASMPWPGNIEELSDFIDGLSRQDGREYTAEAVLAHVSLQGHFGRIDLTASLREARRQFEREYIAAVLERHRWSMSEAARTLGIERANLYRKTRQLGITRGSRHSWVVQS